METELQIIKKKEIIFPVEINEDAIVALEKNLAPEGIPKDLTIKKNYELVVDRIRQARESRGAIKKHVKFLKEEKIAYNKKVNLLGNSVLSRVVEAETPWKEHKFTFDTAAEIARREKIRIEEERIDKISIQIAEIGALVSGNIQSDSIILSELISDLKETSTEWAGEFAEKAKATILETKNKIQNLLDMKIQAEQAEEMSARAEEEKAKKEAEDRIKQAAIAEENQKLAANLQAEQKIITDAAAKLQADQDKFLADRKAEIDRQEEVKRREVAQKVETERLVRLESQRVKDQEEKEEADRKAEIDRQEEVKRKEEADKQAAAEQERLAKEKARLADENLGQAIAETVQGLKFSFPVKNVPTNFFETLIQDIRTGNFKHLAWVD